MTELDILEAVKLIQPKNCKGIDRIPQRILVDGISILIKPLTKLLLYDHYPQIYIFKKGDSKDISLPDLICQKDPVSNLAISTWCIGV